MKRIVYIYIKCYRLLDNKFSYIISLIIKGLMATFNVVEVYIFSLLISSIFVYDKNRFRSYFILAIILIASQTIFFIIEGNLEIRIRKNTNVSIKKYLIQGILSLPPNKSINYSDGKYINIVMQDSLSPSNFVYLLSDYLIQLIVTIVTGIIMLRLSLVLSICSILMFPIITIINNHFGAKIKTGKKIVAKENDDYMTFLEQILSSSTEITVNKYQDILLPENEKLMEQIKKDDMQLDILQVIIKNVCNLLNNIHTIVIVGIGGIFVFLDKLNAAAFYSFCSYAVKFNKSIVGFSSFNIDMQQILISVSRVLGLLDEIEKIKNVNNTKLRMPEECYKLTVKNAALAFGEKQLFDQINISLHKGEQLIISGNNGTGKTSILKMISDIYAPTSGTIEFNGKDINNYRYDDVVKNITFIFQKPIIYPLKVIDNLRMGNKASDDEIVELCKFFDLHEDIMALPDGYDTVVNKFVALSSGQEKKIQVIRQILAKTPIILLDEPLTCLDKKSQRRLQEYIKQQKEQYITIVVSHVPLVLDDVKNFDLANKILY